MKIFYFVYFLLLFPLLGYSQRLNYCEVHAYYGENKKKIKLVQKNHYNVSEKIDTIWKYENNEEDVSSICNSVDEMSIYYFGYKDTSVVYQGSFSGLFWDSTSLVYSEKGRLVMKYYFLKSWEENRSNFYEEYSYSYLNDSTEYVEKKSKSLESDRSFLKGKQFLKYNAMHDLIFDSSIEYITYPDSVIRVDVYSYFRSFKTKKQNVYGNIYIVKHSVDTFFTNKHGLLGKQTHMEVNKNCNAFCNFSSVFYYDKTKKLIKSVSICFNETSQIKKTLIYNYFYY